MVHVQILALPQLLVSDESRKPALVLPKQSPEDSKEYNVPGSQYRVIMLSDAC